MLFYIDMKLALFSLALLEIVLSSSKAKGFQSNQEKLDSSLELQLSGDEVATTSGVLRKTKIVCTIGPSTNTREMIWKLAEAGMNVARLNMSHGDHESHRKVIDLVKDYNAQTKDNVIAIMLDTKVNNLFRAFLLLFIMPLCIYIQWFTFSRLHPILCYDIIYLLADNHINCKSRACTCVALHLNLPSMFVFEYIVKSICQSCLWSSAMMKYLIS